MMEKPNILYLHSHDTGRYIQPYGAAVPTPNLQRLAEAGMLFTQAFSCAPTCSASRAALLTGQVPHSCGQLGLRNRGFELRDKGKHLAHTLAGAGYFTGVIGVHHLVNDPASAGYRQHYPTPRDDLAIAAEATQFLENPPQQPFFLAVGFLNTHREFPPAGETEDARYCAPPAPLPNTPETRRDMADFKASARILDTCMGQVLAALEQNGLAENTLVICTTDHGLAFPRMKCNLTDHGTGVMLILRGPQGFSGGQVCDALVSHLDIFPTLCEVAGLDRPGWLQGHSLLPLVKREVDTINEAVYAEVNYHAAYEPMRAARTRRWKYIRRYANTLKPILPNIDDSPAKDVLVEHDFAEQIYPAEALYDLIFDPHEACNLAQDPAHAEALAEMRGRLQTWMERTDDPLLDGPIPLPANAFASEATDFSPKDIWQRREQPPGYG